MITTSHDAARSTGTDPQMTSTATARDTPGAITLPRSVQRAFRLHLVQWLQTLSWPWGILGISFVVNLAIFASLGEEVAKDNGTGGLASIYIVIMIAYLQAITQLFPFALGIGLSRRSFFLGTTAFALAESLLYGVLLYLCSVLEEATDGWGVALRFFRVPWVTDVGNAFGLIAIYTVPLFGMAAIAMALGGLHKRWGATGLLTLTAVASLVLGGSTALITGQDGWKAFGDWFAGQTPLAIAAGWPLPIAALALAGAWLTIRRATP